MAFFDLASDALNSNKSRPDSLATNVADVVLPIPGGPESSTAFQGPFGEENVFPCALGLLKVCSQRLSPGEVNNEV